MPDDATTNPSNQPDMRLIGTLRIVGLLEGVSFLLLLGIAMPLKHVWKWPHAVKWVGWAHGILFMAFVSLVALCAWKYRWPIARIAGALLAAVLPFGTFVFFRHLGREQAKSQLA